MYSTTIHTTDDRDNFAECISPTKTKRLQKCKKSLWDFLKLKSYYTIQMDKPWQDRLKYESKEDTTGFGQKTIEGLTDREKEQINGIKEKQIDVNN